MAAERADPSSTLNLYRQALRIRRELPTGGGLKWLSPPGADTLVFTRPGLSGAINLGDQPATDLPAGEPLLASGPGIGATLPPDTAAWWRD